MADLVAERELAINGGKPTKTTPNPGMFPGGSEIGEEEKRQVLEVLEHGYLFRYYNPPEHPSKVVEFEKRFTERMHVKHALMVNSCTSALINSLVACGVGPGQEVIVPGFTFWASAGAVLIAKALPVIAEVDDSLTLDPADFEAKITPHTTAVIPVHMRGAPARMDEIMRIAKKHDLVVVEDVAQAMGGSFRGQPLGSFGDCNAFSMQYYKIITAGEGGVIGTNDDMLYERAQAYHDSAACWRPDRFGPPRYPGENLPGANQRVSEVTGAIAVAQLAKLDGLIERMRRNKARVKEGIGGIEGIEFRRLNDPEGDAAICLVFYLADLETRRRFVPALKAEGVAASELYDPDIGDWHNYYHWLHLIDKVSATAEGCPYSCPYYEGELNYSQDMCPTTLEYLGRSVHIDIHPQMTEDDCDMVAEAVRKVARAYL